MTFIYLSAKESPVWYTFFLITIKKLAKYRIGRWRPCLRSLKMCWEKRCFRPLQMMNVVSFHPSRLIEDHN